MERSIVERYERKWYGLVFYLTVALALVTLVYGVFNISMYVGSWSAHNPPAFYWPAIYVLIGLTGILTIFAISLAAVALQIRFNKKLRQALGSEMHRDTENRATRGGFYVFLFLLAAMSFMESFVHIMPFFFVRMALLLGTLSMLIAWLYYNREVK